jgi:hypothetical protein
MAGIGDFNFDFGTEEEEVIQAKGGDVGVTDYLLDVPKGIVKGASQAVQGLLQLGAMPIDYLANTDLLTGIENLFENITPDTKTPIGDLTSVITQFGVPFAGALKIAGGINKLKNLSSTTRLASIVDKSGRIDRIGQGLELTKRAGYFGTLGGITDFAVSTPEKMGTLSDVLDITEETDLEGLTGRDRAAEVLKSKIKFGAEGAVFGAGATLLPQAASLGWHYGILPGAKAVGYVGGKALKVIDYPLTGAINALVGKNETSAIKSAIETTGALAEKAGNRIGEMTGFRVRDPITGELIKRDGRYLPIENGWQDKVRRAAVRTADMFKSDKGMGPEIKGLQEKWTQKIAGRERTLKQYGNAIQQAQEDILSKFEKMHGKGESNLILQVENNKIDNLIKARTRKEQLEVLTSIPKEVRKDAKRLKKLVDSADTEYKIFTGGMKGLEDAALDYNTFSKQRFGSYNNKKFKFNPLLEKQAYSEFEKIVKATPEIMGNIKEDAAALFSKFGNTKSLKDITKELTEQRVKRNMLNFKQVVIAGNKNPEQVFNNIGKAFGLEFKNGFLKKGEKLPDAIIKMLSIEEGRTAGELIEKGAKDAFGKPITKDVYTYNAMGAAMDVVINQSKQVWGKKTFDAMLKTGLNTRANPKGMILTKESIDRLGILNDKNRVASFKAIGNSGTNELTDLMRQSDLFNGQYFAAPEIANAIVGAKEITNSLYNIPFYKGLMTLKAGAQISKTILSPMTQVRNFTTAAMFPLASGLIGGKIGFKDAWRLTGEDIFAGAKTNAGRIQAIERLIDRGVIDQNINVQEMKRVLSNAKDGKINFTEMMNSKPMQKLTDIYQGSDNYWKIYSDNFYQGALKTAFGDPTAFVKGSKQQAQYIKNMQEWFETVGGQKLDLTDSLTGAAKTPREIMEEASSYLVTNTIPTYSKVPIAIENIRNLPLGNFIAFPAEILRTTSNIFSIGTRELTSSNPFIRQMGARRLVGISTVLGGLGTAIQKGAQYATGVDNEKMDSFQRSFAPQYQKNSTLIPVSAPDENGVFKYYNFSYSNPYDSLVTPVNAVLGAFSDGSLNKENSSTIIMNSLFGGISNTNQRKGALIEFLSPFISESIGTERAFDVTVRGGTTSSGKTIYYDTDKPDVVIAKSIEHILGGLTPGAVTSAQRIWQGATDTFTDYGTKRDGADELLALMSGVRIEEAKPLSSMPFIINSFNGDKKTINQKFSRVAYSAASSPEAKLAAYRDAILQSFDSQNKFFTTLTDAQNLGVDQSTLKDVLENRMTKSDTRSFLNGVFKAPNFSEEAFKSLHSRLDDADPFVAAKIIDQNEVVISIFKDIKQQLRSYELDTPIEELQRYLDEIMTPGVTESRDVIGKKVSPASRTTAPRVELNPNISQAGVSEQVVAAGQPVQTAGLNFGQRFLNNPSTIDQIKSLKIGNTNIA